MDETKGMKDEELPGVSVVIPAYNYARFLPFAVESARSQDYPKFEVVVIDDGSKDNTAEVMKQFSSPVRYVYQDNVGLSAARNSGIREAKYDFVAFLDADDEFRPGLLREGMSRFAELVDEYGLVACAGEQIDVDGKPLYTRKHVPETPREVRVEEIVMRTRFMPTGVICRKHVFDSCGGFDTQLKSTEDRDMWIRIAARHRVFHQGKVLANIRKHGDNMSNNADQQQRNMSIVLKKSWRNGVVPRVRFWFWLQVFSYRRYQAALIYNGIKRPWPAFRDLLVSILYWPVFFNPASTGDRFMFRCRQLVRFTLNALRGEVKR